LAILELGVGVKTDRELMLMATTAPILSKRGGKVKAVSVVDRLL